MEHKSPVPTNKKQVGSFTTPKPNYVNQSKIPAGMIQKFQSPQ